MQTQLSETIVKAAEKTNLDEWRPLFSIQAMLVPPKLLHGILQVVQRLHHCVAFAIIGQPPRLQHKRIAELLASLLCLLSVSNF